jgi:hypothetical protein
MAIFILTTAAIGCILWLRSEGEAQQSEKQDILFYFCYRE